MELAAKLSLIAIVIGLFVFTLVLKNGFKKTTKYALGIPVIVIALMSCISLLTNTDSNTSLGWVSLFLAVAVILCFIGSIVGLAFGYIYKQCANPRT